MPANMKTQKPYILMCASSFTGHVTPLVALSKGLQKRGYDIGILTGTVFRERVYGLNFYPFDEACDFDECTLDVRFPGRAQITDPKNKATTSINDIFIEPMSPQHQSLQRCLEELEKGRNVSEEVVVVCDFAFLGILPGIIGAKGLKPKGYISICLMPLALPSVDLPPFGDCELPDSSPEARKKFAESRLKAQERHRVNEADFKRVMASMGIQTEEEFSFLSTIAKLSDFYLQLGMQSFEYPRSDLPLNFRFAGAVPDWGELSSEGSVKLGQLLENTSGKRIVAVAQSTLQELSQKDLYSKLVIPTINALASDPTIVVIAILARRGATLPESFAVPANTRVVEFMPYDALLPHVDVFVNEGGYGGILHALKNGIPVVVAGGWGDKPEVAMRVQRSGLGVDLKTGTPSEEEIAGAVTKVLECDGFKTRAKELQNEINGIDSVGVLEECIGSILMK